jgi:hypothetical protein
MLLGDMIWGITLAVMTSLLAFGPSREAFLSTVRAHPYVMGFVKVSVLATMGELLARRIVQREWSKPAGLVYRFILWGLFGMSFALVFDLFASGTAEAIKKGLLPVFENGILRKLSQAFWTSVMLNLIFAPTFMSMHRIVEGMIEEGKGRLKAMASCSPVSIAGKTDWADFLDFVVLKSIPFFWIPAHTVTFMLPAEYRVLCAAYLAIVLGAILAFAKLRKGALQRE